MREIKYRGKQIYNENNPGKWEYGYLVNQNIPIPIIKALQHPFIFNDDGVWQVDPETVGQYTGLKDKNGKEIYEGDIVEVHHRYDGDPDEVFVSSFTLIDGVVQYSPAEFYINGDGWSITCHFHYNDSDRNILGNIYENPELLK